MSTGTYSRLVEIIRRPYQWSTLKIKLRRKEESDVLNINNISDSPDATFNYNIQRMTQYYTGILYKKSKYKYSNI